MFTFGFDAVRELDTMANLLESICYGEIVGLPDLSPYDCRTLGGSMVNEAYWTCFYILKGEPEVARNFFERFRRNARVYDNLSEDEAFENAYENFCEEFYTVMKEKENENMNTGSEYEKMLGIIVAAVGSINEGNSADDKIITDLKRYANAHDIMEIGYAADCMREHIELGTPETYFNLLMIELDNRSPEIMPRHKTIWKHIVYELFIMVWGKEYTYDTTYCSKPNMNKENKTMDLNLKDNLVFGYEDAFNRIVGLVDDIMDVVACDDDEFNIDYFLKRCKKFDEWTKTLHHPNEIWYKDVTDRAVDCIRGYLVGFDMTNVFGNFMDTVAAHSSDNDIPEEAGQPLKRLIHTLWVLTYGSKLDFNYFNSNDSDLYQKEALRTEAGMLHGGDFEKRLENGLMGLNGEAGECIDLLKKHLFQGHPLDFTALAEELGDVAWYLAVSANVIGYDLSDIFEMNIKKLRKRYPDGFEVEKSVNREV